MCLDGLHMIVVWKVRVSEAQMCACVESKISIGAGKESKSGINVCLKGLSSEN